MTPLIVEIDKLIKEWERAHPGFTGKIVFALNYHQGNIESVQKFTGETIKLNP